MIKICNIDFKNQTVGDIEIHYDNVKSAKFQFTKTLFKVTILNNNDVTINKKIKKEKNKDVVEEVKEEVKEDITKFINLYKDYNINEEIKENIKMVIQEKEPEEQEEQEQNLYDKTGEFYNEFLKTMFFNNEKTRQYGNIYDILYWIENDQNTDRVEIVKNLLTKTQQNYFNLLSSLDFKYIQHLHKYKGYKPEFKELGKLTLKDFIKSIDEIDKKEEEEEEEPEEYINLDDFKTLLLKADMTDNTTQAYLRTFKHILTELNEKEIYTEDNIIYLLKNHYDNIIKFLIEKYQKPNTLVQKLSSIKKAYELLLINDEEKINNLKILVDKYNDEQTIRHTKEFREEEKTQEEGEEILKVIETKQQELKKIITDDIQILNEWRTEAQLYAILSLWRDYGALRGQEMRTLFITDKNDETRNNINVVTGKIFITDHKRQKEQGDREINIITDKKLLNILKRGLNKYICLNSKGEPFKDTSGYSTFIKNHIGYIPTEIRKVITSDTLNNGSTEEIRELSHNQGHSVKTQCQNYFKFRAKAKKECLISDD